MSRVQAGCGFKTVVEDLACAVPERAEKIPNDRSRVPDVRKGTKELDVYSL